LCVVGRGKRQGEETANWRVSKTNGISFTKAVSTVWK
jgi:hypothetical protein